MFATLKNKTAEYRRTRKNKQMLRDAKRALIVLDACMEAAADKRK